MLKGFFTLFLKNVINLILCVLLIVYIKYFSNKFFKITLFIFLPYFLTFIISMLIKNYKQILISFS